MKERPILFSAPMVRALLDGSKTQTRRAVKQQPIQKAPDRYLWQSSSSAMACCEEELRRCLPIYSKYGQPGERLWVRETHLPKASGTIYRADFSEYEAAGLGGMYGGWKPSIFCKREHSRILLEITGVRVERLQDISEADAIAEGIEQHPTGLWLPCEEKGKAHIDPIRAYRDLWETIHGPVAWNANPLVWVIEFKRVLT